MDQVIDPEIDPRVAILLHEPVGQTEDIFLGDVVRIVEIVMHMIADDVSFPGKSPPGQNFGDCLAVVFARPHHVVRQPGDAHQFHVKMVAGVVHRARYAHSRVADGTAVPYDALRRPELDI